MRRRRPARKACVTKPPSAQERPRARARKGHARVQCRRRCRSISAPPRRRSVHRSGRSRICPLCVALLTRSSAAVMIWRWASTWKGTPKWWPIRKGTKTARGGLMCSVTSRATVTDFVGMPRRSMARWTSPTDWWQIGQAGASRAVTDGVFELGDTEVERGGVIRGARLAWQAHGTVNATKDNVIVYPCSYTAQASRRRPLLKRAGGGAARLRPRLRRLGLEPGLLPRRSIPHRPRGARSGGLLACGMGDRVREQRSGEPVCLGSDVTRPTSAAAAVCPRQSPPSRPESSCCPARPTSTSGWPTTPPNYPTLPPRSCCRSPVSGATAQANPWGCGKSWSLYGRPCSGAPDLIERVQGPRPWPSCT